MKKIFVITKVTYFPADGGTFSCGSSEEKILRAFENKENAKKYIKRLEVKKEIEMISYYITTINLF